MSNTDYYYVVFVDRDYNMQYTIAEDPDTGNYYLSTNLLERKEYLLYDAVVELIKKVGVILVDTPDIGDGYFEVVHEVVRYESGFFNKEGKFVHYVQS